MKLFIRVRFLYYNQKKKLLVWSNFLFFFRFFEKRQIDEFVNFDSEYQKNPRNKGNSFFESLNNHLLEIIKIGMIDIFLKNVSKIEKNDEF